MSLAPQGVLKEKGKRSSVKSESLGRDHSIEILNDILADEYILFTKTLNYHWNIDGDRFFSLHQFLENQYNQLIEKMDMIAERVKIINGYPVSTSAEMGFMSNISEMPGRFPKANVMLKNLFEAHQIIVSKIKTSLRSYPEAMERDPGTEDLLVEVLRFHEKTSWMIKAHIVDDVV